MVQPALDFKTNLRRQPHLRGCRALHLCANGSIGLRAETRLDAADRRNRGSLLKAVQHRLRRISYVQKLSANPETPDAPRDEATMACLRVRCAHCHDRASRHRCDPDGPGSAVSTRADRPGAALNSEPVRRQAGAINARPDARSNVRNALRRSSCEFHRPTGTTPAPARPLQPGLPVQWSRRVARPPAPRLQARARCPRFWHCATVRRVQRA